MSILSIQSWVAYGHVGNAAVLFPFQLLGYEVWPVNTVNYSNHPAYSSYKGGVYHPDDVAEIIDELDKRGVFPRCDLVLSGFLGEVGTGPVVLDAVARARAARPGAVYVLDPVMGNPETGLYVHEDLPEFFREQAVPEADIVIANAFELQLLTGAEPDNADRAAEAAGDLLQRGPGAICVTGIRHDGFISNVLVTADQAWQATTSWIDVPAHGAGDLYNALFVGDLLRRGDPPHALAQATAATFGILRETWEGGRDALALVAGAQEILEPSARVDARPLWGE